MEQVHSPGTDGSDDWRRFLDEPPPQRGAPVNIKRIEVDGRPIRIETAHGVEVAGIFNGYLKLHLPATVANPDDPAINEARAALEGARGAVDVEPVMTLDDQLFNQEEAEMKEKRLKERRANDQDVVNYLKTQVGRFLAFHEIYAGVYEISLTQAAGEIYCGYDPLFAPEFSHLDSLKDRRAAFRELPEQDQLALRQQYGGTPASDGKEGSSSPHRMKCRERREAFRDLVEVATQVVMVTGNDSTVRAVEYKYRDRKKRDFPDGALEKFESEKLSDAKMASVYGVMPQ